MRQKKFECKAHCCFFLTFHCIFVTKFRYQVLTPEILEALKAQFNIIAQALNVEVLEFGGEADHIHFILKTTPQDNLGQLLKWFKCLSSMFCHRQGYKFPYYGKHKNTLWSSGYFVCSTGGAPLEIIRQYVDNQGRS